jgi:hypothetical protein
MTNSETRQAATDVDATRGDKPCRACGRVPDGVDVMAGNGKLCRGCQMIWSSGAGGKEAVDAAIKARLTALAGDRKKADAGSKRTASQTQRTAWRARIRAKLANLDRASPARVSEVVRGLWDDEDRALILTAEPNHYADEFELSSDRKR